MKRVAQKEHKRKKDEDKWNQIFSIGRYLTSRWTLTLRAGQRRRLGFQMQYADGNETKPGDVVQIDCRYRGTAIASMDLGEYLPGQEQSAYLEEGIMVDTDFAGLVHYTTDATDDLVLLKHPDLPNSTLHTDPQAGQ
jgi:hypothetical protein